MFLHVTPLPSFVLGNWLSLIFCATMFYYLCVDKYLIPICRLYFSLINSIFWKLEAPNFKVVKFINLFVMLCTWILFKDLFPTIKSVGDQKCKHKLKAILTIQPFETVIWTELEGWLKRKGVITRNKITVKEYIVFNIWFGVKW